MKAKNKAVVLAVMLLVWVIAIVGGLKMLGDYSNTPGNRRQVLVGWPIESAIKRPADQLPTLIIFLHPKCPCSKASVAELDAFMAQTNGNAHVYAAFVQPRGWSESETKGLLWKQASSIPGVVALLDSEGKEAKRFGAMTSGHVLAFDNRGQLAFSGGITPSRGHMGENVGLQSVVQFVREGSVPTHQSKVFGCSLFSADKGVSGKRSVAAGR